MINPSKALLASTLACILFAACTSKNEPAFTLGDDTMDIVALPIKDKILSAHSADCADYQGTYTAEVTDIQAAKAFTESVKITSTSSACTFRSNSVPNHDFDDASAHFATPMNEFAQDLQIPRNPSSAAVSPGRSTALTQGSYDAVMLNGVVLDILSAGCYRPSDPMADANGNVRIGCSTTTPWLLDPLSPNTSFGTDAHNAHTQPDGLYHYHGNPKALFDDQPGDEGSPVIGFAADGFPLYGSYFKDSLGVVRKAVSGYQLKSGTRSSGSAGPGGTYDGTYNDDYAFIGEGDLDECNGMKVNGQYGYYITDSFPWAIRCFVGAPHTSFKKHP